MSTPERLRTIEFQILLVLTDGEAHGYGIMQEIESRTGGEIRPEPGTLYRALRRLEDWDYVAPAERRPAADLEDERRRYFSLTESGRAAATAEARRLATLVDQARSARLLESN